MKIVQAPALWFVILLVAVLWPSRFLGPLDGMPLDRAAEAILIGLVLPWLFWLGRGACRTKAFRVAVLALLVWKAGTSLVATQQGLCVVTRAPGPLSGIAFGNRIDEPRGFLRSWDLRADLWQDEPGCTAILTRPLRTIEEFPAWFLNITDPMMGRRDFTMTARGYAYGDDGATHPVDVTLALGAGAWALDPVVNDVSVWRAPLVTTAPATAIDRALAPWAWLVAPLLCALLIVLLLRDALSPLLGNWTALAWVAIGSGAAVLLASSPLLPVQRLIGALAFGALAVRVANDRGTLHTAAWLIGAPWIAFFAALSLKTVGLLSAYSKDDWLAYQLAGYRIYMNGNWLEGGSLTFDYQPLYRWLAGALHLIFGDSSVGELYWDASCVLAGALLAFQLTRSRTTFRWALGAAAMTLATITIATPWYILGRGLSEITAAGCAFAAMACLIRSAGHRLPWITLAALMGALTFYARLNHLLWIPCLVLMLLPLSVGSDRRSVGLAVARLPLKSVAMFWGVFAAAIVAFMTRTWYFTGTFSLFLGTALRHNDTGLRPWHVFDAAVWSKVGHSLMGLVFMNEPPQPDARALVMATGVTVAVLALLQLPIARRIPAALLAAAIGGVLAAFLAHSHAYPGRFTIHLIPLASALTAIAAASAIRGGYQSLEDGSRSA